MKHSARELVKDKSLMLDISSALRELGNRHGQCHMKDCEIAMFLGLLHTVALVDWIKHGPLNVMIVTEGVDIPTVECVVMGRPSMSKALVFQMIGRGMRLSEGKDYLLVVDSVENCTDPEIGLPTNIQEWSLEPRGDKTVGDAPAKQCLPKDKKGCGIVMPTGSHHCPSCGKPQGSICGRCHAFRFQWFVSRRRRQCSFCDAEDDQRRAGSSGVPGRGVEPIPSTGTW